MSCVVEVCSVVSSLEVFFSELRIANFNYALFAAIIEHGDVVLTAYLLDSLDNWRESRSVHVPRGHVANFSIWVVSLY